MSQTRKLTKKTKHQRRRQRDDARHFEKVVQRTTTNFSCSTQIADDFVRQCARIRESLECDILFNNIALELWQHKRDTANKLLVALADFAAERKRHLSAIDQLNHRFEDLASDDFHIHLEPIEHFHQHIRHRLGPETA